jgi:G protein beta subunit-like protein
MSVILATAGYDHKIKFWEAPSAVSTKTLPFPDSQVNCLEITPDKQFLAAGGNPHIRLYEINGGGAGTAAQGPVLSCEGHTGNVSSLGFQTHGRWMYSGSEDGTIKVYDLRSPTYQRSFNAKSPVRSVTLHPNQLQLVSGDSSGSVKVWDLRQQSDYISMIVPDAIEYEQQQQAHSQQPQMSMPIEAHGQLQQQQQLSPQRQQSVSSGSFGIAQGSASATTLSSPPSDGSIPIPSSQSPSFYNQSSSSGRGNIGGSASVSDPQPPGPQNQHSTASTGFVRRPQSSPKEAVPIQAITMNDHYMVAVNNHGQVFVWDHFGSHTPPSTMGGNIHHHHLNPHAHAAAAQPNLTHNNTAVSICNLRPVKTFAAHPPGSYCLQAKLSPDGRHLVTTSSDWTARLWDTTTWGLSSTLAQHTKWVWDAVFSADSSYLVTASSDASARLWNLRNGEVVRQYSGHQGAVTCVALNDNST